MPYVNRLVQQQVLFLADLLMVGQNGKIKITGL